MKRRRLALGRRGNRWVWLLTHGCAFTSGYIEYSIVSPKQCLHSHYCIEGNVGYLQERIHATRHEGHVGKVLATAEFEMRPPT